MSVSLRYVVLCALFIGGAVYAQSVSTNLKYGDPLAAPFADTEENADWRSLHNEWSVAVGKDSSAKKLAADASALRSKAKQFAQKHAGSKHASTARKIASLTAMQEAGAKPLTPDVQSELENYIRDSAFAAADRFEVSAALKQRRSSALSGQDRLKARLTHAEELISEFPQDERGYALLFFLAAAVNDAESRKFVENIAKSPVTPPASASRASRLLRKENLKGTRVQSTEIQAPRRSDGRVLVYSWNSADPSVLSFVQQMHASSGGRLELVGINLDQDTTAARHLLGSLQIPGTQLFDGPDLKGVLAENLSFNGPGETYLLDHTLVFLTNRRDEIARLCISKKGGVK